MFVIESVSTIKIDIVKIFVLFILSLLMVKSFPFQAYSCSSDQMFPAQFVDTVLTILEALVIGIIILIQIMNMIRFELPTSIQEFQQIKNVNDLREKLKIQDRKANRRMVSYRLFKMKNIYIYAKCRFCAASMRYKLKQNEEVYNLTYSNINHTHPINRNIKNECLISFIKDLPSGITMSSAKKIVKKQFGITDASFYYFFNKAMSQISNFQQLLHILDEKQYDIRMQPFVQALNQLPDLLVLTSPSMKRNYHQYGLNQFASFDLTFNLIRQRKNGQSWKLGVLMGKSGSCKLVPFSLVVVIDQTKDRYVSLFKTLAASLGGLPQFLITDQSPAIIGALKQMKEQGSFNGYHGLDIWHILRNIKSKLKNKQNLTIFSKLAKCQNQIMFEQQIEEAYQRLQAQEIRILQTFIAEGHNYCFSKLPRTLIGFSSSDGLNEKVHDLLKGVIPYETKYQTTILRSVKLLEQLSIKCVEYNLYKIPTQNYYPLPELKLLRFSLDSKIFEKVIQQMNNSIFYKIQQTDRQQFMAVNLKYPAFKFKITSNQSVLQCQCKFNQRTGIVCSHLLKFSFINNVKIFHLIHQRWKIKINQEKQKMQYKSNSFRGRGRKSRRNRL